MIKKINYFFGVFIVALAIGATCLCVYHYGMDVRGYYEEQMENVAEFVQGTYPLEKGVVIEQTYANRAPYAVGVDLILLGMDQEAEGDLFVQLCDESGNVLAQKRESLDQIEAGQFYEIRFLEAVDVHGYENLMLRIYAESANCIPELLAVSNDGNSSSSIKCSRNGEMLQNNLAINYVCGQMRYVGYEWQDSGTKQALVAAIVLIILCALVSMCIFYNREKMNLKECAKAWRNSDKIKQGFYIVWFFCVFLGSSAVYKIRNDQRVPLGVYIYIAFTIGVTVYYFYRTLKNGKHKKRESGLFDKGAFAVVLLSTLVRIPLFLHIQLLDGAIYYGALQQACRDFEYSLTYIWENFRLAGHYAIAYAIFVSIGEFLLPDHITGVLIVMLILTNSALVCIYKMFRGYWLNLSQKEAAIGTMIVSFCPLFLGLFSDVSLEHLLVIFTIFLFYAEYKEQKVMTMIWLVAIIMTKETGLVIAGGYLFVHLCIRLKETIKHEGKDKIQFFLSSFYVKCAIFALAVICLVTIKQNGLFMWLGMNKRDDFLSMGEYEKEDMVILPLLLQKLKVLFILHFEWIPMLVIAFCVLYCIIKRQKSLSFKGQISFLGALGAFVLANLYLVKFILGRYHIYSAVMIWILAWILLFKVFPNCLKGLAGVGVAGVCLVILLIQNFYFIDPLTNCVFDQYDTGKGKMISTEIDGGNLGDTFTTNFRHTFLYGLIDTMLKDSGFDANTCLIIPYKKDYLYIHQFVGYDIVEKRMVPCSMPDEKEIITIKHMLLEDVEGCSLEEMPERGVMYFLPYTGSDEQEVIKQVEKFYVVSERKEINNWGGTLAYYILQKK